MRAVIRLSAAAIILHAHALHAGVTLNNNDDFVLGDERTGNLTIAGALGVVRGIDFGTTASTPALAAVQLNYFDGTLNAATFDLTTALGSFQWRDNLGAAAREKMQLDGGNILTLYKSDGTGGGILINPNTGQIHLSGSDSGLFVGGNTVMSVDANGNLVFGNRPLVMANPTASTSSATGALTVAGGIGVAMDSYINGIRVGRGGGNSPTNTAYGAGALQMNTTGTNNTAIGNGSLYSNRTGISTTTVGSNTLCYASVCSGSVAIGTNAGTYQTNGTTPQTMANYSIYIGAESRGSTRGDRNSIVIGYGAIGEGINTTVIGNSTTTTTHLYGTLKVSSLLVNGYQAYTSQNLNLSNILRQAVNGSVTMSMGSATGQNATAMSGGTANGMNSTAMSYGTTAANAMNGTAMSYGRANAPGSTATSWGTTNEGANCSTAMSGGITAGSGSTAMSGGTAAGRFSTAAGFKTTATAYASGAFGCINQSWGNPTQWVETDPLWQVGNGTSTTEIIMIGFESMDIDRIPSNAITTLKNGQTTLTNKQWKANAGMPLADPATTDDSGGEALVVEGHTRLKGKVIIEQAQGDISMGVYGDN